MVRSFQELHVLELTPIVHYGSNRQVLKPNRMFLYNMISFIVSVFAKVASRIGNKNGNDSLPSLKIHVSPEKHRQKWTYISDIIYYKQNVHSFFMKYSYCTLNDFSHKKMVY